MPTASDNYKSIRVMVCDDHPIMRHGLRAAIEPVDDMTVIAEVEDGEEAIARYAALQPTVTLVDLQMPKVDGLEAIRVIRDMDPKACIVVLTSYPGDARVVRALALGATSYLLKSAPVPEVIRAIRAAVHGRAIISPELAHQVAVQAGTERLSERETTVLRYVSLGHSNKEIAKVLSVSEDTVKSRLSNAMAKLGAADRTHAVILAVQRGFLDTESLN